MIEGKRTSQADAQNLASSIEQQKPTIVHSFEERLKSEGSALAHSPVSLNRTLDDAGQVITDVTHSLRAGKVEVDWAPKPHAPSPEVAGVSSAVPPKESIRASSLIFDAALTAISALIVPGPDSLELFVLVSQALERSITLRIRQSVVGYSRLLLNKVHAAQIGERRRIARELHDRVGHGLSVSHRQLELAALYCETHPERSCVALARAQQAVRESMHQLRAVTSDLHAHEPLRSLETALRNDLDSLDPTGVTIEIRVNGDETWARPEVFDEVFFILREAARNALKHATPSRLVISVDITPSDIQATVEDDGCGYVPRRQADGIGMLCMKERADQLGGRILVDSQLGSGTTISLSLPLEGPCSD
ncbi:sensor histidine kinase [Streptomyces albidoflavus]|uniref:sensor histidine kinase n=1 Tax=Streptomyces albidoflavus TaxID=1886 RepID=UPI0002494566